MKSLPSRYPNTRERDSSRSRAPIKPILIPMPVNSPLVIDRLMANRVITTTSAIMVTPTTVWVKGPMARSSLITAMVAEGERATRIDAPSRDTATRPGTGRAPSSGI